MNTIDQLFTSKARIELLKLFLLNEERDFYLREAAAHTGLPLHSVQREVQKLEKAGLVERAERGNRVYLRANRTSPIFKEMRSIIIKTVGLGDALRRSLEQSEQGIKVAFIFGSLARGEETSTSDIDLMLIGTISGRELASLLSPARQAIGREINQVILTEKEFRQRFAEQDNFLVNVMRQPKLFIIGDQDVINQLDK